MRIDRDAPSVVEHRQDAVRVEIDLDDLGVLGDRLVHRVVEDFGEQVVQGPLVGAADIHAGAFADGLQPFQHLDRRGGVAAGDVSLDGLRRRCGLQLQGRFRGGRGCAFRSRRLRRFGHVIEQGRDGGRGHGQSVRRFGDPSGRPVTSP